MGKNGESEGVRSDGDLLSKKKKGRVVRQTELEKGEGLYCAFHS